MVWCKYLNRNTVKNVQVAASLLPACFLDIRIRSRCLLRHDDNKSSASCQQAWYKLIDLSRLFNPQTCCKFFWATCSKSTIHKAHQVWFSQARCNQRVDTIKREMFSQKSVRRFVGDSSAFVMGAMFLASALNRGIHPPEILKNVY